MNITDVRQMSPEKLHEELQRVRRELAVVRFHVKTGQETNTAKVRELRKLIAQILTILNQKSK